MSNQIENTHMLLNALAVVTVKGPSKQDWQLPFEADLLSMLEFSVLFLPVLLEDS